MSMKNILRFGLKHDIHLKFLPRNVTIYQFVHKRINKLAIFTKLV